MSGNLWDEETCSCDSPTNPIVWRSMFWLACTHKSLICFSPLVVTALDFIRKLADEWLTFTSLPNNAFCRYLRVMFTLVPIRLNTSSYVNWGAINPRLSIFCAKSTNRVWIVVVKVDCHMPSLHQLSVDWARTIRPDQVYKYLHSYFFWLWFANLRLALCAE